MAADTLSYEAETLPGLEPFAADELQARFGSRVRVHKQASGGVPFAYSGKMSDLDSLHSVTAVYRVMRFDVPRPKALLGHQHFTALTRAIRDILPASNGFVTLSIDAAGAESSVMVRLRDELAGAVQLSSSSDKGDLHLRLRRDESRTGWEALIRLTPRPLVTRAWRVHNYQGALNAAVAYVIAGLTQPQPSDRVLNLCCGTASLMIERAAYGPSHALVGLDISPGVLNMAQDHLAAATLSHALLVAADAVQAPVPADSFDVLLADLPFGQLVGSHQENIDLYPALMAEAARIAVPGARFALITHEKRLMTAVLRDQDAWQVVRRFTINLNGLHPEIIILRHS